jgi:hypothetical protein
MWCSKWVENIHNWLIGNCQLFFSASAMQNIKKIFGGQNQLSPQPIPTNSAHSRSSDSVRTTGSDMARSDGSSSPSKKGSRREKAKSVLRGIFSSTHGPDHPDEISSDIMNPQSRIQARNIVASSRDDALPPQDESQPLVTIQTPSVDLEIALGSPQFGPPASLHSDSLAPEDGPKRAPKSIGRSAINAGKKVLEIATESSDAFAPLKSALGGIRAVIRTCEVSTWKLFNPQSPLTSSISNTRVIKPKSRHSRNVWGHWRA